jgi:SAM-dependent methyltransferase
MVKEPEPPEFRYEGLFRIASLRVPYVPLFVSWDTSCHEYRWADVRVETIASEFQLPKPFLTNPLPKRFQKEAEAGKPFSDFGKCRLVSYTAAFGGTGVSELRFVFSPITYFDYLRSGEYLDQSMPDRPGKTFRDVYAPTLTCVQDLDALSLTNICGVGVFLLTSDNKVIISRHSPHVEVCKNVLSYSASGTIDWNRAHDDNPFTGSPAACREWLDFLHPFSQVTRECQEETYHVPTSANLRLFGFGIDTKRLYFQFSFFERTSLSSEEILANAVGARDRWEFSAKSHAELKQPLNAVAFDLERLVSLIKNDVWEPAAEAAMLSLCVREFGFDAVRRAVDAEWTLRTWQGQMADEWKRRGARTGVFAVMSSRYERVRLDDASEKYVAAVMDFIGEDVDGRDVLEIGSGEGRITERLVQHARKLTCVDLSETMIARNRERLKKLAEAVDYHHRFAQDYVPQTAHDVAVCSLVLIHNVEDNAFHRLVKTICDIAGTVFLFEHVDAPRRPHAHTRLRRELEILEAFEGYDVVRRAEHLLFEDRILFVKLQRQAKPAPPASRAVTPKYDAFIVYHHCQADLEFAWKVLRELEAAGYVIAIDGRDFQPQATVVEETERCMVESRFTLVVASAHYCEGGNSKEETVQKVLDAKERTRRLIPLRVDKCKLPPWIDDINGIDFSEDAPMVDPLARLKRVMAEGKAARKEPRKRTNKQQTVSYDVFLAHNSEDKAEVLLVNEELKRRGIRPWIDVEEIPPGRWFQDVIQKAIPSVKSAAIFLGPHGIGRWQAAELRMFMAECVERGLFVIPILLPGVKGVPEEFQALRGLNLVKFHDRLDEKDALDRLQWGITGKKPRKK